MTTSNPLAGNPLVSRSDLARAVRDLFEPLIPAYRSGGSRVSLGETGAHFDKAAEDLEGFSRPLWGIVPMVAGGLPFAHWDLIHRGLTEGPDPASPGFWGRAHDHDQRLVEMAALGVMLALVPEHAWDPLDGAARDRLVAWLGDINTVRLHENNWQFFRVLVNLGLARVGVATAQVAVEESLAMIDSHFLGEGWYRDGEVPGAFDHYIPWAYHFYGLLYAKLAGEQDPGRSEEFRARARRFATDYRRWFDRRGAVVPFGRSLTYRFATGAFWGALVFADEEALPWSTIKGLYLRHLRWWSDRRITRPDGTLSIGYAYGNQFLAENYNSPGSPYWAMKAFFALGAPTTHPFWDEPEDEPAVPVEPSVQVAPAMIISEDETHAVALNGGKGLWLWRQGAAKYGKFAYSSRFAFSLDADDPWSADVSDSMLTLQDGSGRPAVRDAVDASGIIDDVVWSRWRPFDGVTVSTVLHGGTPWHTRIHHLRTDRPLLAVEAGFAVGWDGGDPAEPPAVRDEHPGGAAVTVRGGTSAIVDHDARRAGAILPLHPTMNLVEARVLVPVVRSRHGPGEHRFGCDVGAAAPGIELTGPPDQNPDANLHAVLDQVVAAGG